MPHALQVPPARGTPQLQDSAIPSAVMSSHGVDVMRDTSCANNTETLCTAKLQSIEATVAADRETARSRRVTRGHGTVFVSAVGPVVLPRVDR